MLDTQTLLPHLFRTEFRKITAVLVRRFGLGQVQQAEDLVSETFLLAAETWATKGLPDNPTAWLYHVAKNKAKDHLKRQSLFEETIAGALKRGYEATPEPELDLSESNINDSQLQMLFAISHPLIPKEAQIGLALRILCGFGIEEIADAFLTPKETINKRLYRARQKLREAQAVLEFPPAGQLAPRLQAVLTTLYLLFNEGYYSALPSTQIRHDLCLDAMRLVLLLLQEPRTQRPEVHALMALMCFHASRFQARLSAEGEAILYHDQDPSLWDQNLIAQGQYHLNASAQGHTLSKYHLEAAIAYWHSVEPNHPERWENVLQLYNRLLQVEYSPMAALTRTYALAQARGSAAALPEAQKLNLTQHAHYHVLLAHLLQESDATQATKHLRIALTQAKTEDERKVIGARLEKLEKV